MPAHTYMNAHTHAYVPVQDLHAKTARTRKLCAHQRRVLGLRARAQVMVWRTNFDRFLEDYASSHVIKGALPDPVLQAPPVYANHAPLVAAPAPMPPPPTANGARQHLLPTQKLSGSVPVHRLLRCKHVKAVAPQVRAHAAALQARESCCTSSPCTRCCAASIWSCCASNPCTHCCVASTRKLVCLKPS